MALNPKLTNRKSALVLKRKTKLATYNGMMLYNETFSAIDAALWLAQVIVYFQGKQSEIYRDEITAALDAIEQILSGIEDYLQGKQKEYANLLKSIEANGESGVVMDYTDMAEIEISSRTPLADRYAKAIQQAETIYQQIDRAWYGGKITSRKKADELRVVSRNINRRCNAMIRLARGMGRRVMTSNATPGRGYAAQLRKHSGVDLDLASTAPYSADAHDSEGEIDTHETKEAITEIHQMVDAFADQEVDDSGSPNDRSDGDDAIDDVDVKQPRRIGFGSSILGKVN